MKEYLFKYNNQYTLVELSKEDAGSNPEQYIEVPEGADAAFKKQYGDGLCFFQCVGENGADWCSETKKWISRINPVDDWYFKNSPWQRHTQPEELPFIDDEPKYTDDEVKYMDGNGQGRSQSINDQYAEIEQVRKHRHYFKDTSNIAEIDVYAVLKLFEVTDPCLQHIVKKALCAGKRGHKDMMEDLQNIVDTAIRAVELNS